MRQSQLFTKTSRYAPKDEVSKNAQLLIRAGFIHKEMAGVYSFLPLGFRVLKKIENIVREGMKEIGAQEMLMPALHPKQNWQKTGRWKSFNALFRLKSSFSEQEYALGPTHEEIIVPLVKKFISSYKDLPLYAFHIQTKFRDEKRAKSGLLRTKEFLMKDLYSFHATERDFNLYYEKAKHAYKKIFSAMGLDAIETEASGGDFSRISHEYQVITQAGEDEIIYCPGGDFAANSEISPVKEGKQCDLGHGPLKRAKAIEVGNIFPLKTKFSESFGLTYKDSKGEEKHVIMGCYGIGISRLMGTVVEVLSDEKGIVWPSSVAPFSVYLIALPGLEKKGDAIYTKLQNQGIEVLYDDRIDIRAGEKFADADLIGIPWRVVISEKTIATNSAEVKRRDEEKVVLIKIRDVVRKLKAQNANLKTTA